MITDPARDDIAAYDPDDYKRPGYAEDLADAADNHRKD